MSQPGPAILLGGMTGGLNRKGEPTQATLEMGARWWHAVAEAVSRWDVGNTAPSQTRSQCNFCHEICTITALSRPSALLRCSHALNHCVQAPSTSWSTRTRSLLCQRSGAWRCASMQPQTDSLV